MKISSKWEDLHETECTIRLKVIGGWLVQSYMTIEENCSMCMAFVPDPYHKWEIK